MLKSIISKRRIIQLSFAVLLYFASVYFNINLIYIILFGSLIGVIFGKIFCRWMCPIGFVMELFAGKNPEGRKHQLYMYHKLGCPIAWISGFLNKFSLFKVRRDEKTCVDCGKCDKVCYIASLNKEYSLYKKNKDNPSTQYSCSKCLECVKECPTNSLSYRV